MAPHLRRLLALGVACSEVQLPRLVQHRSTRGTTGTRARLVDEPRDASTRVHVLTDELYNNATQFSDDLQPFWTAWRRGAAVSAEEVHYKNYGSLAGPDAGAFARGIRESCGAADALVVSVPFVRGTAGYRKVDDAINACLDARGDDFPIFSTAYDTYKNARLYGYVGSENFAVGQKCARALLFVEDEAAPEEEPSAHLDAVSGRGPPLPAAVAAAEARCPNRTCQVYWPRLSRNNSGMAGLLAGMNETLRAYGFAAEVIAPAAADERAMIDARGGFDFSRVETGDAKVWPDFASVSNGFTVLLTAVGQEVFPARNHLLCGTVVHGRDAWMIGASPFRQGLTAVSSAAAAARVAAAGGVWEAARGNNEADVDSQSVVNPQRDSVGRASRLQLACSDDAWRGLDACAAGRRAFAYDAGENSLGAILAFAAYGDSRVLGGTILDSFGSDCWRGEWGAEWGRPVGELAQFYHGDDDVLAYVALLAGGERGETLAVNFRGTQGTESVKNWMANLRAVRKKVDCPPGVDGGKKCSVHSGFWDAYQGLVEAGFLGAVKKNIAGHPNARVVVTGHSLGGAMATLMAFDAASHGIEVDALYTVGSPRVYDVETRNRLEAWRPFPCWRSVYNKDPVPSKGPEALGFRHVCVEVFGESEFNEDPFFARPLSGRFGDGSGRDKGLSFARRLFDFSIFDHGTPYLSMHGNRALAADSKCLPLTPQGSLAGLALAFDDASCEERCLRKTGSASHKYLGPGRQGWLERALTWIQDKDELVCSGDGSGGDCDAFCGRGYCTFAEPELSDYPDQPKKWDDPWDCTEGTGRACCCEKFQTSDGVSEVVKGGSEDAAARAGPLLVPLAVWLLFY